MHQIIHHTIVRHDVNWTVYSKIRRNEIQWWQKFHSAVTWDTGLINTRVPSYSRIRLLPPLYFCYRSNALYYYGWAVYQGPGEPWWYILRLGRAMGYILPRGIPFDKLFWHKSWYRSTLNAGLTKMPLSSRGKISLVTGLDSNENNFRQNIRVASLVFLRLPDWISTVLCHSTRCKSMIDKCGAPVEIEWCDRRNMREATVPTQSWLMNPNSSNMSFPCLVSYRSATVRV